MRSIFTVNRCRLDALTERFSLSPPASPSCLLILSALRSKRWCRILVMDRRQERNVIMVASILSVKQGLKHMHQTRDRWYTVPTSPLACPLSLTITLASNKLLSPTSWLKQTSKSFHRKTRGYLSMFSNK